MRIAYSGNIKSSNLTEKWGKTFQKEGYDVLLLSDYNRSETRKVENENGITAFSVAADRSWSRRLITLSNILAEFALGESGKDKSVQHIRSLFQSLSLVPQLEKIVEAKRIDVIHMHYMYRSITLASVFVQASPTVLSLWGSDIYTNPRDSGFREALATFVLRKVNLVHVPDKRMAAEAIRLGCPSEKIFVEPWIIDTDMFKPTIEKETETKRGLSVGQNDIVVLSTRSLSPVYNIDLIIKAIPYVIEKIRNVKFVFVGSGSLRDDLERMAKDLGVFEHVRFVGSVHYSDMPLYYHSSDIYVQMPSSDGLPYSLLEAMACGLPVVSTPVGANPENVEDGSNGFLVDVGNYEQLAERIILLATEKSKIREFGKRSSDLIQRNHEKEGRIQRYKGMYETVVRKDRG